MARKFDVGDVVKVRTDVEARHYDECGNCLNTDMLAFKGKYVTINGYCGNDGYYICGDNYLWYDCWFEDCVRVDKIIIENKIEYENVLNTLHHTGKYVWRAGELPLEGPSWNEVRVGDKMELDITYKEGRHYISYRSLELSSDAVPYGEIIFDDAEGVYTTIKKGALPVGTQLFRENNPVNVLTDEEFDYIKKEMKILLETYGYDYNDDVIDKIIRKWNEKKGWLINLLKSSKDYKEGKFMIEVPTEFRVGIDTSSVAAFRVWFYDNLDKYCRDNEARRGAFSLTEINAIRDTYNSKLYTMRSCNEENIHATYLGMSLEEVEAERDKYCGYRDELISKTREVMGRRLFEEDAIKAKEGDAFCDLLLQIKKYVDKDGLITEYGEKNWYETDIPHSKGMKFMRYVAKLAKKLGIDKIVDVKTISYTDDHGVHHEKEKDMGWNYYRAMLGDALSQQKVKKKLFISVNPIDYLTMSFLNGVGSCHTIDKENRRGCDSDTVYSGCYSSGTISYMLDDVSFVVYEVYNGDNFVEYGRERSNDITRKTKQRRAMFVLDDNKLFMSRLYPDGRDGGDEDMASHWNNYVKEIVSGLLSVKNEWDTERGVPSTSVIDKASSATLYPDFRHYSDVFKSELKLKYKSKGRVTYGAAPICIVCGNNHATEDNIVCECCSDENYTRCERCGERIDPDDYDVIWIDGYAYCDCSCAEADDAHYCEDTGEYSFNGWWSEAEEMYFSDDVDCETVYYTSRNCASCSWDYAENNCIYDDLHGNYVDSDAERFETPDGETFTDVFYPADYIVETHDGYYFPDGDYAKNNGYVYVEEYGDWWLEKDALDEGYECIDGVWQMVDKDNDEESEVA